MKADQLLIAGEKTEESSLQIDSETNISKMELNGGQAVTLEGSGTIGDVEVKEPVSSLAVYATCKVTTSPEKHWNWKNQTEAVKPFQVVQQAL